MTLVLHIYRKRFNFNFPSFYIHRIYTWTPMSPTEDIGKEGYFYKN